MMFKLFAVSAFPLLLVTGCALQDAARNNQNYPAWSHYSPLGRDFGAIAQDEAAGEIVVLSQKIARHGSPDQHLAELLTERGLWRRAAGDLVGAIDDFTEALEIAPNNWEPLLHRWQACVALGDSSGADRDVARGLKLNPDVFGKTYHESSMTPQRTHGGVI